MSGTPINRLDPHWPQPDGAAELPPVDPGVVAAKVDAARQRVEKLMGDHPQVTVLAAAAAGVLVGWFVKRK